MDNNLNLKHHVQQRNFLASQVDRVRKNLNKVLDESRRMEPGLALDLHKSVVAGYQHQLGILLKDKAKQDAIIKEYMDLLEE